MTHDINQVIKWTLVIILTAGVTYGVHYWYSAACHSHSNEYADTIINENIIEKDKQLSNDSLRVLKQIQDIHALKTNVDKAKDGIDQDNLALSGIEGQFQAIEDGNGKVESKIAEGAKLLRKLLNEIRKNAKAHGVLKDFYYEDIEYDYGASDYSISDKFYNELNRLYSPRSFYTYEEDYLYDDSYQPPTNYSYKEDYEEYDDKVKEIELGLSGIIPRLEAQIKNDSTDLKRIAQDLRSLSIAREEFAESYGNQSLINIAIPVFGVVVLLLIIIPIFGAKDRIGEFVFGQGVLVQIITIFLLIITILILGLGDILDAATLGTLLGGISVYVLQRSTKEDFQRSIEGAVNNQELLRQTMIKNRAADTSSTNPNSIPIPTPVPADGPAFTEEDLKPFQNQ